MKIDIWNDFHVSYWPKRLNQTEATNNENPV